MSQFFRICDLNIKTSNLVSHILLFFNHSVHTINVKRVRYSHFITTLKKVPVFEKHFNFFRKYIITKILSLLLPVTTFWKIMETEFAEVLNKISSLICSYYSTSIDDRLKYYGPSKHSLLWWCFITYSCTKRLYAPLLNKFLQNLFTIPVVVWTPLDETQMYEL